MKLKTSATAMVFGIVVALFHAVWMLMVWIGVGQLYLDWIFGLHLLSNPFKVMPFSLGSALALIVFTFAVGYLMGWVFAFVWNKLHKAK